MKKSHTNRLLAVLLAVALCLAFLPVFALADDAQTATLVTNVNDLAANDKIVIVSQNYALGTTQNSNNRNAVTVSVDNDKVTVTSSVQIITLEDGASSGTFSFNVGDGYLYAASSSKNYLRTQTSKDANASWNISVTSDGVATIIAQGSNTRNNLRFNSTNNPPLFACYSSGQNDVSIYKLDTGSTAPSEEETEPTETEPEETEPEETEPEETEPEETEPEETKSNTYVLSNSVKDGDKVILVHITSGNAMQTTDLIHIDSSNKDYLRGASINPTSNKITTDNADIVWTVKASGDNFQLTNAAGDTLSCANGLGYGTTDNVWAFEFDGNTLYIKSTTAVGTSGDAKYIEWFEQYTEFSTYYKNDSNGDLFAMNAYVLDPTAEPDPVDPTPTDPTPTDPVVTDPTPTDPTPTTPPVETKGDTYVLGTSVKDGDKIILVHIGTNNAMNTTNLLHSDSNNKDYVSGVVVNPISGKITTENANIVWTVKAVEGGFQLTNAAGETLSCANGLAYGTTDNVWAFEFDGNTLYIKSTTAVGTSGDAKYIEWYDQYNEFSTYYKNDSNGDLFAMNVYVLDPTAEPVEPSTPATGDNSMAIVGAVLMVLAVSGVVVLVVGRKKWMR